VRHAARERQHAHDRRVRDRLGRGARGARQAYSALDELDVDRMVDTGREGMQPFQARGFSYRRKELARPVRVNVFREQGDFDPRALGVGEPPAGIRRQRQQFRGNAFLRGDGGNLHAMLRVDAMGKKDDQESCRRRGGRP
jgi:hypothetical protein